MFNIREIRFYFPFTKWLLFTFRFSGKDALKSLILAVFIGWIALSLFPDMHRDLGQAIQTSTVGD